MTVTKGVVSTDPLGVAGRATCRPFGDGLVSTHPIPFGNISLTAKTERNTSPFHGLHDGDKGGGFNPHPFAWQAEPWLLAVSRVSVITTKGVVSTEPLLRGRQSHLSNPLAMGSFQLTPSPPATSVLPPRLNENETFAVSRVSMMTRTSVALCDAGSHGLSHMRFTSSSEQRPFCYNVTCYMLQ